MRIEQEIERIQSLSEWQKMERRKVNGYVHEIYWQDNENTGQRGYSYSKRAIKRPESDFIQSE